MRLRTASTHRERRRCWTTWRRGWAAKILRGLSRIDGRDGVYKLHRLTGSVDVTLDPIVATVKKAVEVKCAAVRNELVRTLAKMVTECGVKDSLDGAAEIEERLGIAQEMLRRNVFQSSWEFNRLQSAATTANVAHAFGLEQRAADAKGGRWR